MSNNVSSQGNSYDIVRWERDKAPSGYILHIESFSGLTRMVSETGMQCYECKCFESSGYDWKLSVYPAGDEDRNSTDYISMFLCIENRDALHLGWEIHTDLKFFIFDQIRDKYSVFQCEVNRFDALKPECGIAKLVSRDVFDDPANGYLVNDKCVFGVEVCVLGSMFAGERLSPCPLVRADNTFTWKITDFSNWNGGVRCSKEFTAGSFSWKLELYPLGGLYLKLVDGLDTCDRLLVHYMLCIRNQKSRKNKKAQGCAYFGSETVWGWDAFVPVSDLRKESKGLVVGNCMIIEAQIKNVSKINSLKLASTGSSELKNTSTRNSLLDMLVGVFVVFAFAIFFVQKSFSFKTATPY